MGQAPLSSRQKPARREDWAAAPAMSMEALSRGLCRELQHQPLCPSTSQWLVPAPMLRLLGGLWGSAGGLWGSAVGVVRLQWLASLRRIRQARGWWQSSGHRLTSKVWDTQHS